MQTRFRVIETTTLEDGSKRYRVVDPLEGGSVSKHSVFKVRTEADAVCSILNVEQPKPVGARDTVPHMGLQRTEDSALSLPERACIGGEVQCLLLQNKTMTIQTVHRFDDYEQLYEQMFDTLPSQA
ncbi:hypothetical protein PSJE_00280 [Pseudomonas jessenii]|nr:hypothetical protein PSJE_00280 [Pseudomonas jessenii]